MVREIFIAANYRFPACQIFSLKILTIGGQNKFNLLPGGCRTLSQLAERLLSGKTRVG